MRPNNCSHTSRIDLYASMRTLVRQQPIPLHNGCITTDSEAPIPSRPIFQRADSPMSPHTGTTDNGTVTLVTQVTRFFRPIPLARRNIYCPTPCTMSLSTSALSFGFNCPLFHLPLVGPGPLHIRDSDCISSRYRPPIDPHSTDSVVQTSASDRYDWGNAPIGAGTKPRSTRGTRSRR